MILQEFGCGRTTAGPSACRRRERRRHPAGITIVSVPLRLKEGFHLSEQKRLALNSCGLNGARRCFLCHAENL